MKTILCIPTLNAENKLQDLIQAIDRQTLKPDEFLIIDSSSTDKTVEILKSAGARVYVIPRKQFNHGGTRNLFIKFTEGDIYIFLTQDAIPAAPESFENLLSILKNDPKAGLAYGRQLPYPHASAFGAHHRLFNYPEKSARKTLADSKKLGIKTPFCSNSFSAYRALALNMIGGFPENTILGEDTYASARMLLKGWVVHYAADATVYHSHDYSILQEFKRYFDLGVFYGRENWIQKNFGNAEGEGKKFLISELNYLRKVDKKSLYLEWFFRNSMKWVGYRLGMAEKYIPIKFKSKVSMHKNYWG
jgi:rhamnosyltransferase